ncbi:MAG: hypothetical protein U1E17_08495 [Geminicoccaceae bacterium]|mgnify:FL=1
MTTILLRLAEQVNEYWQATVAVQVLLARRTFQGPTRRPAPRLQLVHARRAA